MKIKCSTKLGGNEYQFIIEERDEMETLHKAIVLTNPKKECDECGNKEGFYFASNKDREGNVYVNVKCGKCGADSKLGQYKTSGYFWHDFEKREPKSKKKRKSKKVKKETKQEKNKDDEEDEEFIKQIDKATTKQRKTIFAIGGELDYLSCENSEEFKEKVKEMFDLESFNDITYKQADKFIGILRKKQKE